VLHALDESKVSDNTLVIFTSDNGAQWTPEDKANWHHPANANWRGMKADIWDAGYEIPFLARWPGKINPRTVCGQFRCLTDLMATAAGIVHFKLPKDAGEDRNDFVPALLGQAGSPIWKPSCITQTGECSP
jgi:arylsulfatase A-like enzyme